MEDLSIKTAEVIGSVAERIYRAGKFVLEHFQGGAWADLSHSEPEVPDNIIKGEE